MKVGVFIQDNSANPYLYGMTILEKDYVDVYDCKEAALALIAKIFNDSEVLNSDEFTNHIKIILGGAVPYETTIVYKTISEDGLL